jgi:hypothetical protein
MLTFGTCPGAGTNLPAINDKTDFQGAQYLTYQDWTFTRRFSRRQTRPSPAPASATNHKGTEIAERDIYASWYPCIGAAGYYYWQRSIQCSAPLDDPEPNQDVRPSWVFEAIDIGDPSTTMEIARHDIGQDAEAFVAGYSDGDTIDGSVAAYPTFYGDSNALTDGYVYLGVDDPNITNTSPNRVGIQMVDGEVEEFGSPAVTWLASTNKAFGTSFANGVVFVPFTNIKFRITTTIGSWAHIGGSSRLALIRLALCMPGSS